MTYIRWLQAKGRKAHADKIADGKARGRPPTPQFIIDAILAIKQDNPRYFWLGRHYISRPDPIVSFRPHKVVEDAAREVWTQIEAGTELCVLNGSI